MSKQCSPESIPSSLDAGFLPGPQAPCLRAGPGALHQPREGPRNPCKLARCLARFGSQHPTLWCLLCWRPGTLQTGRLAPLLYQPGSHLHPKHSCRGDDSVSSANTHPSMQAFCKFRSALKIYPEPAVFSSAVLLAVSVATSRLGHRGSLLAGGLLPLLCPPPQMLLTKQAKVTDRITSLFTSSQSS